jgi:hypothetical protein
MSADRVRSFGNRLLRVARWAALGISIYLILAYLALPAFWRHYEHLPAMAAMPKVTRAPSGLPADPLNVALVGSEDDLHRVFAAAGWRPADPITLRSSLGIAKSVVLDRPDPAAPVSTLFLFGRRQDLALEKDVGGTARERHHVRLWRTRLRTDGDRPLWVGAATFDRGVGLSHTTGQITHHIAPDIDAERETLVHDLEAVGQVKTLFYVTGIGPTVNGHNGGGDRYFTDGELAVAVLVAAGAAQAGAVERLPSPTPVVIKSYLWSWIRSALGAAAPPSGTD